MAQGRSERSVSEEEIPFPIRRMLLYHPGRWACVHLSSRLRPHTHTHTLTHFSLFLFARNIFSLVLLGLEEPEEDAEDEKGRVSRLTETWHVDKCEASAENCVKVGVGALGKDLYARSALPSKLLDSKWQIMQAKNKQAGRVEKIRVHNTRLAEKEKQKADPQKYARKRKRDRARLKRRIAKSKLLANGDVPPWHPCGLINATQTDTSKKWQAPVVPYHIWASKASNAVLITCILAPYTPILVFYAIALLASMYIFEIWSLIRLHAKPQKRGVEGASIIVDVLFICGRFRFCHGVFSFFPVCAVRSLSLSLSRSLSHTLFSLSLALSLSLSLL